MKTHLQYFYQWEQQTPDAPFLKQPSGDKWKTITYREAGLQIRKLAAALQGLGMQEGNHIGIISKNCYHWAFSELAISMAGCVSVPFYPSLNADELQQVLELGDVDLLIVGKLDEWENKSEGVPKSMPVIRFPHYPGNAKIDQGHDWDALLQKYDPMEGQPHPDFDKLWTIIFTSGTTGIPKGVMHNYQNVATLLDNEYRYDALGASLMMHGRLLSFLPLNHVAERFCFMALIYLGGCISYTESIDSFPANLKDTQPHLFLAVPRLWDKFQTAVLAKIPQKRLNLLLSIPLIGQLVKSKIRKTMGLNSAVNCYTSTAITPQSVKDWYAKLGIQLREVYGLTECLGPFTIMPNDQFIMGSVGKAIPECECKTDPQSGELIIKAGWLLQGYYKDEERTEAVLKDGWYSTGDKAEIDEDGFVKIIGRINDTFKTSKGKFIVPANIEKHFAKNDLASQICVMGLGLNQPLVLIVPSDRAKEVESGQLKESLEKHLREVNEKLHSYEKLSHLVLVKEIWSDENGLLTPTLKLRRNIVRERYENKVASWSKIEDRVILE